MRILYLAHRIPYPPDKGDKIRAYHQLRHLAGEHEVYLSTLVDDRADLDNDVALRQLCREVDAAWLGPIAARGRALRALLGGQAFSPAFFAQPALAARVEQRLQRGGWDAVLVFSSGAGGLLPGWLPPATVPCLADFCDLDSAKWSALATRAPAPRRWLYAAEAARLADYELRFGDRCHSVVFATPQEAEDFTLLGTTPAPPGVHVIANGVDHAAFARGDRPRAADPSIVFTGAMDYRPNFEAAAWFIDNVWPFVLERVPRASLWIVGRQPPASLMALGNRPGVRVTGTVPDVRPYLHAAWVSVAPLLVARGVQNKVLEAMAAGVPTIISPAVARGLEARPETDTLCADSAPEWKQAVVALLQDAAARDRLGRAGLTYVHRHHDWTQHGRRWLELLSAAAAGERTEVAA